MYKRKKIQPKESEDERIPSDLKDKVLLLFGKMDVDGSKSLDRQEALTYWSKNFAKLNTMELFEEVDKNDDNKIEQSEWLEFWIRVYESGRSKEEVITVVRTLIITIFRLINY